MRAIAIVRREGAFRIESAAAGSYEKRATGRVPAGRWFGMVLL
jgi:hypothetical protein